MIFNGGKVYRGNVILSNSRVVGVETDLRSTSRNYDETLTIPIDEVATIIINSDVNVKVCNNSTSNEVIAHLCGYAITNGILKLVLEKKGNQMIISSKVKIEEDKCLNVSRMPGTATVISDCSLGIDKGIKLFVKIPCNAGVQVICNLGEGVVSD